MTQFEYEVICETLKVGCPALADRLINSIVKIITDNSDLKVKQEELQKRLEHESENTVQSEEE